MNFRVVVIRQMHQESLARPTETVLEVVLGAITDDLAVPVDPSGDAGGLNYGHGGAGGRLHVILLADGSSVRTPLCGAAGTGTRIPVHSLIGARRRSLDDPHAQSNTRSRRSHAVHRPHRASKGGGQGAPQVIAVENAPAGDSGGALTHPGPSSHAKGQKEERVCLSRP